jgi:hypothetical protein
MCEMWRFYASLQANLWVKRQQYPLASSFSERRYPRVEGNPPRPLWVRV